MIEAMRAAGLESADELIQDGKIHRYDCPGDRPKSKAGWYVLFDGYGKFGSHRTGYREAWSSKKPLTPEERKEWGKQQAEMRRQQAEEQKKIHAECREWCATAWKSAQIAGDDHPYLVRKGVKAHGVKVFKDSIMVPLYSLNPTTIHGVQFIYPDGSKKFKVGTDKQGRFHLIGKPVDNTVIVCEGYATGASIHEATGHAVAVAFDAGNLKPVAEYLAREKPGMVMIIAADNDQWKDCNTGLDKGMDAAKAVGAEFRMPRFEDVSAKPTDYNDLHLLEGADAVRLSIFPPPMEEYHPHVYDDEYEPPPREEFTPNPLNSAPFQCLGYNNGEYFYLPKGAPQVRALTPDRHSSAQLMSLAPLQWWEGNYPGRQSFDSVRAANAMLRAQEQRGVYDNRLIRGRGAWEDGGRTVLHLGNELIVDGKSVQLHEHSSKYIYEAGGQLELDGIGIPAMSNADAHKLLDLISRFNWERPEYAELLAGWMVVAPMCGVMSWRPHILITGAAGTGKSTVSDFVVKPVVGPSAITCMGNTTEAGLRGEAGSDARPVLFDEAESGGDHAKRMQAVLELARQSSSDIGYSILKGSQSGKSVKYLPRLCFCFSAIGAAATQQADNDRITTLSLVKDLKPGSNERWAELKRDIFRLLTPDYCRALRARSYSIVASLRSNASTFSSILGIQTQSQRKGDQLGALLAGAYSLRSRNPVTDDVAMEFIKRFDFDDGNDKTNYDEEQCLGVILQHQIRMDASTSVTIGELLESATLEMNPKSDESRVVLLRHGIKVNGLRDGFSVANKHTALDRILERTPWSKNWGLILARLPGAVRVKPVQFTTGVISRAVFLPMSILRSDV